MNFCRIVRNIVTTTPYRVNASPSSNTFDETFREFCAKSVFYQFRFFRVFLCLSRRFFCLHLVYLNEVFQVSDFRDPSRITTSFRVDNYRSFIILFRFFCRGITRFKVIPTSNAIRFTMFLIRLIVRFRVENSRFATFLVPIHNVFLKFVMEFRFTNRKGRFVRCLGCNYHAFVGVKRATTFHFNFHRIFFRTIVDKRANGIRVLANFRLHRSFISNGNGSCVVTIRAINNFCVTTSFFRLTYQLYEYFFSTTKEKTTSTTTYRRRSHHYRCRWGWASSFYRVKNMVRWGHLLLWVGSFL